jgi:glutathione-regulated potassium-efflux system ancillary protein KefC
MESVVFELSVIIISTATLCFIAELTKQPLIVAYIAAGFLLGPYGLNIIHATEFFTALSQIGIVLLLYLIGLELKPEKFAETLKRSYRISLFTTLALVPLGFLIGWMTNLSMNETTFLTISLLFSSTVVVLKKIQDDRGVDRDVYDTCIGILLIQDIIAVLVLIVINSLMNAGSLNFFEIIRFVGVGVLFISSAFFIQHYALRRVIRRIIDRTDLVFLIGLAWCFLYAELAEILHFSREIGGFVAGLSLTSLPQQKLQVFIHKSETIRDFFMILFFFLLGANLQFMGIQQYSLTIFLTLGVVLIGKPLLYNFFSQRGHHNKKDSKEIAVRLGQNSEFSIIIALLAASAGQITNEFAMVIQLVLFISIIISNYVVKFSRTKKKRLAAEGA